jgi:hypothetical protein
MLADPSLSNKANTHMSLNYPRIIVVSIPSL